MRKNAKSNNLLIIALCCCICNINYSWKFQTALNIRIMNCKGWKEIVSILLIFSSFQISRSNLLHWFQRDHEWIAVRSFEISGTSYSYWNHGEMLIYHCWTKNILNIFFLNYQQRVIELTNILSIYSDLFCGWKVI